MSKRRISPNLPETIEFQAELNLLYRRRLALVNLIRSLEEYNLTSGMASSTRPKDFRKDHGEDANRKNLRVIFSEALDVPA